MTNSTASYQVDAKWRIIRANETFCRTFRSTETGLIGRDVRDLLRQEWRLDFRAYVARALVGVGDLEVTLPMAAPCGWEGWFKHSLEPVLEDGLLSGYRATIVPDLVHSAPAPRRWWEAASAEPRRVWDFGDEQLARVG